ncbi:MAG: hypothetical protein MHM6MM_007408 [Cercozoa sp. M6MM]
MNALDEMLREMEDRPECPICCNDMDATDLLFKPCPCGFQLCLWCYHRVLDAPNARCPACRRTYDTSLVERSQPTAEAIEEAVAVYKERLEREREERRRQSGRSAATTNQASHGRKRSLSPSEQQDLQGVRVKQRNLVYVTGLTSRAANQDFLSSMRAFGKYGKVVRVMTLKNSRRDGPNDAMHAAFITFRHDRSADEAIKQMHGQLLDGHRIGCQMGTNKYCAAFLNGRRCTQKDCHFLHARVAGNAQVGEELLTGKESPRDLRRTLPSQTRRVSHVPAQATRKDEGKALFDYTAPQLRQQQSAPVVSTSAQEPPPGFDDEDDDADADFNDEVAELGLVPDDEREDLSERWLRDPFPMCGSTSRRRKLDYSAATQQRVVSQSSLATFVEQDAQAAHTFNLGRFFAALAESVHLNMSDRLQQAKRSRFAFARDDETPLPEVSTAKPPVSADDVKRLFPRMYQQAHLLRMLSADTLHRVCAPPDEEGVRPPGF